MRVIVALVGVLVLSGCTPPQCAKKAARIVRGDTKRFLRLYNRHSDWRVRCMESEAAGRAILRAKVLVLTYNLATRFASKAKTPGQVTKAMTRMHQALEEHTRFYADIWLKAINDKVRLGVTGYIDFSFARALGIVGTEFTRLGVFRAMDKAKAALAAKVTKLAKDKYAGHKAGLTVLSQFETLANSPRGSYNEYRRTLEVLDLAMRRAYKRMGLRKQSANDAPPPKPRKREAPVVLPDPK